MALPSYRKAYRLERLSNTEGLILQRERPIAYFGTSQSEAARAVVSIQAALFLLTADRLSLAGAVSAGDWFSSERPRSAEVDVRSAERLLKQLAALPR